jgi:exosortase family protein XrtF
LKAQAKQLIKKNRQIVVFVSTALILLALWVLMTTVFPQTVASWHAAIIRPQADVTSFVLKLFGYHVDQDYMVNGCEARIVFARGGYVCLGTGCSGLELFLLFTGFILLMRGSLLNKLWFIPAGMLAILVLNVIRLVVLSVIYYHTPEYLEFNHKYTFVIVVYGAIFGMWLLWVNKYTGRVRRE